MSLDELAWCAGFLDGEGSFFVGVSRLGDNLRYKPFVGCDQASVRRPLDILREQLGGSIHQRRRPTSTGKTVWHWQMTGALMIKRELPRILPFLVVKKDEATLLVEFCNYIPPKGRRPTQEQRDRQAEYHRLIKASRLKKGNRGD